MNECTLSSFVVLVFPAMGLAARILAYLPMPGPSHHFYYEPILRGLAQRGHQIDYYSPFPLKAPHDNITLVHVDITLDETWKDMSFFEHWKLPVLDQISEMKDTEQSIGSHLCQSLSIKKLLYSNNTYDLLIHESMYFIQTGMVFKHKFNVPSVMLAALDDFFQINDFSGLFINPSFMVAAFTEHSDEMSFFQRLHNAYLFAGSLLIEYNCMRKLQRIVDECYVYPGWESRPPLSKLLADQSLILVNNHPSVGFPFPRPPHVKEIGGAVIQSQKPLPQELEDFINGATDGVIYFSLGSLFDWEKAETGSVRDVFFKVLSTRKERILWKLPYDQQDDIPSNVKVWKWFPQQDILAHKNIKLFITHGGLQSTFETVHYGVPVIVIPLFGDQMKNSLAIERHGYGVRLFLDNITEKSLSWALNEVLHQPKYKQQILKGSALLNDRITDPVEEGVYWIEYVLRHGDVLQPKGARLDFIQRYCLDILAFVFTVVFGFLYLTKKVLTLLRKKFSPSAWENVHKKLE